MKKWLPLLLIFFLAAPLYGMRTEDAFFVVPILVFVLLAVAARETGSRAVQVLLLAAGAAVCLRFPAAVLLAPVLFAATVTEKNPAASFVYLAVIFGIARRAPEDPVLLFFLFLLALLFRVGTDRLLRERRRYHRLYNDMQETLLRLEEALAAAAKNKDRDVELALLNERSRLTRDMHDGLGHTLSRTILQVGALEATRPELAPDLRRIREGLDAAMIELRSSLHNLKTEDLDLRREIEELVRGITGRTVALTYTVTTPLTLDAAYSILAIIKEALSNTSRHSDADFVQIKCLETRERIFLIIADNGSAPAIGRYGIGLGSIEERARSLGGQAEFTTEGGFTVRVRIRKETVHATAHH